MSEKFVDIIADELWGIYSKVGETPDQFVANARTLLAALKANRIALIELPEQPSEYWELNHVNVAEARIHAADLLAAADAAEAEL
ncbi:hypothetical protein LITTLEE_80 [Mycobacterium phage LittleE]|uniref:Uncharacterized protein n=1 Tax=Mycobacterium phage LittleE TaxID=2922212 RepID=G1D3W5_9CAUD|nr:DNA methyltransferase [Mycobacterium phage LittleE]AEK09463.1 hypothetical protein LITTLEE_80 [Mycobacterium phage LittleE]